MIQKGGFIFTQEPGPVPDDGLRISPWVVYHGAAHKRLNLVKSNSVRCIITSPPYYHQFDYGVTGQAGLEPSVYEYVQYQQNLASALRRVATNDANFFFVIRDSNNGSGGAGGDHYKDGKKTPAAVRGANEEGWPRKAQLLIPELIRRAFTQVGWVPLRRIIWNKEDARRGARDCPSYSYEEVLLFGASSMHYWNRESILTPFSPATRAQLKKGYAYKGKAKRDYAGNGLEDPSDTKRKIIKSMNKRPGALLRSIWRVVPGPQPRVIVNGKKVEGLACFPLLLAEIMVNLGSAPGDIVLDPFAGLGTTLLAARKWGRRSIGIELNPESCDAIIVRMET